MRSAITRLLLAGLLTLLAVALATPAAQADHPQPQREGYLDYAYKDGADPGFFKLKSLVPPANACADANSTVRKAMNGKGFNPSGEWLAFDNNVFEVLCLPFRGAGDKSAADPYGNGNNPQHGFCGPNPTPRPGPEAPLSSVAGECPNHQLEYVEYFEETMRKILGPFGVTTHRYEFENPGSGNTLSGRAINPAAVVPGADHPEETVIIGAHYDQTTEGPASAWDSAEGHAQIIRVAKLMADYWAKTNTRPSATVKFIPWDAEESGTLGSRDYTENNIVPGEEDKVRGYWNTDPCAGGYPAFRNGKPNDRVALGIQLARPEEVPDEFADQRAKMREFNGAAAQVVEDVFTQIDDKVPTASGDVEVFVARSENATGYDYRPGGPVALGAARPVLFSSDWANFLNKGVPFFNPGPEITGPSDEFSPQDPNQANNPDGLAILHTPNDNIETLNKYTDPDQSGKTFSPGWAKGMEMCAHLLAWGMLRSDQVGTQTVNDDVVAYYEALPNEAVVKAPVLFDASGSHRFLDGRDDGLVYTWDFGDGTTGTGRQVDHAYDEPGRYLSKLTVSHGGQSDTMTVPITVGGATLGGPELTTPAEDEDGSFPVGWAFEETARPGFLRYLLEEASDVRTALEDPAEDLESGWTASKPTEPTIQPWQHSDRASGSVRGNVKHKGERSFYTGVNRDDQAPGTGPNSGVSVLTLDRPFAVAKDAELTYRSSYANDFNDRARVEVAIDDGSDVESLDWVTVDRVQTTNFFNVPTDEALYPKTMELRRADLSGYAGQKIRIRFVYALGASQYINVFRTGWYVDDIKVETGTFRQIAETAAKGFDVTGRRQGTYAYRVRGVFADTSTLTSNLGTTRVTVGAPDGPVPGSASASASTTGRSSGPLSGPTCSVVSGLRSLKVSPAGRGLRFAFTRAPGAARRVSVDVFRQSAGRRITGERRVMTSPGRTRSFTWNGRSKKRMGDGYYFARVAVRAADGRLDVRRVSLVRRNGRFRLRPAFYRRASCGTVASFKLERNVFGGRTNRALGIAFNLTQRARVTVEVLRGRRVVKRFGPTTYRSGVTHRLRLPSKGLRRGDYKVRLTAVDGGRRTVATLTTRRL